MMKKYSKQLRFLLGLVVVGQVLFALGSPRFTTPHYLGRIYATTGVQHRQEDLHKLNEAAHYFGQTMIGWLKFPNFMNQLTEVVPLPEGSSVSAHIQERQNIIFTVESPTPLKLVELQSVKDFIQSKIDEYNSVSQTKFVLTNLDYEQLEVRRTYTYGAAVVFLITVVLGLASLFVRKELF